MSRSHVEINQALNFIAAVVQSNSGQLGNKDISIYHRVGLEGDLIDLVVGLFKYQRSSVRKRAILCFCKWVIVEEGVFKENEDVDAHSIIEVHWNSFIGMLDDPNPSMLLSIYFILISSFLLNILQLLQYRRC